MAVAYHEMVVRSFAHLVKTVDEMPVFRIETKDALSRSRSRIKQQKRIPIEFYPLGIVRNDRTVGGFQRDKIDPLKVVEETFLPGILHLETNHIPGSFLFLSRGTGRQQPRKKQYWKKMFHSLKSVSDNTRTKRHAPFPSDRPIGELHSASKEKEKEKKTKYFP